MKKVYLILAATVGMTLASCTTNDYVGEEANIATVDDGSIKFGFDMQNATRADIYGSAAATLLGNNFYVTGTKGSEGANNPSETLVFDSYLVHYEANSAGKSEDNTANWEYVGVTPGTAPYANYAKLGNYSAQTIKYWDYSTEQYDFLAFSTGTYAAVNGSSTSSSNIGVSAMAYGTGLASPGIAYTFDLPSVDALKQTYVTDIVTVEKSNYGQEVLLRFKNLGSKVRMGLYETVPGYSVKDVKFYQLDGTTDFTDPYKSTKATLISANSGGLPTNGTINVIFPHVGSSNASKQDYNKVAGHVTPGSSHEDYHGFGTLDNFAAKEDGEKSDNIYLGRSLPDATYAGSSDASYYDTMFPITSTAPLTLRVDYTLESVDGSGETINVYGAKAIVPATYLNWLPNYAYTYIFKISDNTNGWTAATGTLDDSNQGLFPITFDAVVTEATEATGQQTTITTVAAPSITTYQQNHNETYPNEYSIATGKNIYVQVMDNNPSPAVLVGTGSSTLYKLNTQTSDATNRSLLYEVSDVNATEADVMDALEMRTTAIDASDVRGRNSLRLTKKSINNAVEIIANGADDQPITVNAGEAARINLSSVVAGRNYAYVYDYTSGSKTIVNEYQPISVTVNGTATVGVTGKSYKSLTTTYLGTVTTVTALNEPVDNDYIYFSKTTNGTGTTTYSYVSVAGKTTLPAGLLKVAKNDSNFGTATGGTTVAAADTFYFDTYFSNDGKYAVKVIKIVA